MTQNQSEVYTNGSTEGWNLIWELYDLGICTSISDMNHINSLIYRHKNICILYRG